MIITCRLPYACDAGTVAKLTTMLEQTGNKWFFYLNEPEQAGDIDTWFVPQQLEQLLDLVRRFGITA